MLPHTDSERTNASLWLRMSLFLDAHPYIALCLLLSMVGLIPAFIAFAGGINLPGADATSLQNDDADAGHLELTPYEPPTFALTLVQPEPILTISHTTSFLPSDEAVSTSQNSIEPTLTSTQQSSQQNIAHIVLLEDAFLFALETGNLDTLKQILANHDKTQDLPEFLFISSLLTEIPHGLDIFKLLIQHSSASELIRHYDFTTKDNITISLTLLSYTLRSHLDIAQHIFIRAKELGEQVLSDVMLNANHIVPPNDTLRTLYDDAIATGDVAALKLITSYAPSIKELLIPNGNGVMAFHLAVRLKKINPQLISPFLERAKTLNCASQLLQLTIPTWDYIRPYEHAIDIDDDSLLKVLLDFSTIDDLLYKNAINETVLEYALAKNKASAITLIIKAQRELDITQKLFEEEQKNNIKKFYTTSPTEINPEEIIGNIYFFMMISRGNVIDLMNKKNNHQEIDRHNEIILILDSHIKKIEMLGHEIYNNKNSDYLNRLSLLYESVVTDIHLYWLRFIHHAIANQLIGLNKNTVEKAISHIKIPIKVIKTYDDNIPSKVVMANLISAIQKSAYFVEYFLNNLSRASMFDIIISNNPYLMGIIFNTDLKSEWLLSVFTHPIFLEMIDFESFFEKALVYLSLHTLTNESHLAFYDFCCFYYELSHDKDTLISKIQKVIAENPILSQMQKLLTTNSYRGESMDMTAINKKEAIAALIHETRQIINANARNSVFSLAIHSHNLNIRLFETLVNGKLNIKKLILISMIQAETMTPDQIVSLFLSLNLNEKTSFSHLGHTFSIFQIYLQYSVIHKRSYFSSNAAIMLHYLTHYQDSDITPAFFASTVHDVVRDSTHDSLRSVINKIKQQIDDHIRQRQTELWLRLAYLIMATWVAVPSLYRILQPYYLHLSYALRTWLEQNTVDTELICESEIASNAEPSQPNGHGRKNRMPTSSAHHAAAASQPIIKTIPPQTWGELNDETYQIPELGRLPQTMPFTKLLAFIRTYQRNSGYFNATAVMRAITAAYGKIKIPATQFENIIASMSALAYNIETMSANNAIIPDDMPLPDCIHTHIETLTTSPLLLILLSPAIQRLPETWGELKDASYENHEVGSTLKLKPLSQLFIFLKAYQDSNGHFDTRAVIQAIAQKQNKTKVSPDMEYKVLPAMATLFEEIKNMADDNTDDARPLTDTIFPRIAALQQCLSAPNHDNYYLSLVISQAKPGVSNHLQADEMPDATRIIAASSNNSHAQNVSRASRTKIGLSRRVHNNGKHVESERAIEAKLESPKASHPAQHADAPAIPLPASDLYEQYGAFFQASGSKRKTPKQPNPTANSSTDIVPKVLSLNDRKKYVTLWQHLLSHWAPDATIPSTPADAYKKRQASLAWVLRMMLALLDDNSDISHLVAHKPKLRQTAAIIRNIICHAHHDIVDTDLSAFCRTLSISDDLHNLNKVLQNTRLYQNLASRFSQYENEPQASSGSMFLFRPAPVMAALIANTATNLYLLMTELEGLNTTKKSAADANTRHLIHAHIVTIRELWRNPHVKAMAIEAMKTTDAYSRPVPIKRYLNEMSREANRAAHQWTPAAQPVYDRFFLEIEDIINKLATYLISDDLMKKLAAETALRPSSSQDIVGIKM